MTFVAVVVAFAVFLLFVIILSLHPKTRRISHKLSTFLEKPEVEELKERVDTIENKLDSINERVDGLDKKTDMTNSALGEVKRTLDSVEHRLGSIEDTLNTLASQDNSGDKDD